MIGESDSNASAASEPNKKPEPDSPAASAASAAATATEEPPAAPAPPAEKPHPQTSAPPPNPARAVDDFGLIIRQFRPDPPPPPPTRGGDGVHDQKGEAKCTKTEPERTESSTNGSVPLEGHGDAQPGNDAQPAEQPDLLKTPRSGDLGDVADTTPRLPPEDGEHETKRTGHSRGPSTSSTRNVHVSEYSHQALTIQKDEERPDDDKEWQVMPSYAPYDLYDDDDRLVAREHHDSEDDTYGYAGLGGAGKGYTRVIMDDDADSTSSMDDNTQYLFHPGLGTSAADDDQQRDAVSQLQATKDLLTEGQRIAYVGLTRLEISAMVRDAEAAPQSRPTKKQALHAAEGFKMWGQKMMIRLYAHMEISSDEQAMIEQLASHGVEARDLTPVLMANARVKNPMADDASSISSRSGKGRRPSTRKSSTSFSAFGSGDGDDDDDDFPPPYEAEDGTSERDVKTPSQMPTSSSIDIDIRWTVLCDLFLVLVADSVYDSRSRVLFERVGADLGISWSDVCRFEKKVTDALEMQQAAEKENWNEDEHMETRRKLALRRRYLMMGLATVGGGLVIGLSAGLLAPVIGAGLAAGFTTIGVAGTNGFLAGSAGAAIITSSAAASGSYIGGKAANRRTGSVKTFEYRPLHNNKRVNLIITVSGWLTGKVDDVRLPFSTVDSIMGDIYSILWEPEILRSIGDTINILATEALTQGLQQILGSTILISLMAALQLPIVLTKLSYLIDNPWAVSLDRATAAGLILADSLIDRNLGTRPVTLVGYSLGSRVIFSCLQELARRGAHGLVQNAYLFGSPVVVKKEEYMRVRTVVPGRFVNGYNRNDWILGYLFRLTGGGIRRVAGLAAIEELPWIENLDVTEWVAGHMDYRCAMPKLLRHCGWLTTSDEFTEIEDADPDNHAQRQRELISEIEEARRELEEKKQPKGMFGFLGRKKKAKQEWEVYEDTAGKGRAGKTPVVGGDKTAAIDDNSSDVLFDVEAIRAELSRELRDEDLSVREMPSTLPPMKIDLRSPPPGPTASPSTPKTALYNPRNPAWTQSPDPGPARTFSGPSTPAGAATARFSRRQMQASPAYYGAQEEHQDGIQMSFGPSAAAPGAARPETVTSKTAPNMALANPWMDPDDEDFGKEKEIQMTFA